MFRKVIIAGASSPVGRLLVQCMATQSEMVIAIDDGLHKDIWPEPMSNVMILSLPPWLPSSWSDILKEHLDTDVLCIVGMPGLDDSGSRLAQVCTGTIQAVVKVLKKARRAHTPIASPWSSSSAKTALHFNSHYGEHVPEIESQDNGGPEGGTPMKERVSNSPGGHKLSTSNGTGSARGQGGAWHAGTQLGSDDKTNTVSLDASSPHLLPASSPRSECSAHSKGPSAPSTPSQSAKSGDANGCLSPGEIDIDMLAQSSSNVPPSDSRSVENDANYESSSPPIEDVVCRSPRGKSRARPAPIQVSSTSDSGTQSVPSESAMHTLGSIPWTPLKVVFLSSFRAVFSSASGGIQMLDENAVQGLRGRDSEGQAYAAGEELANRACQTGLIECKIIRPGMIFSAFGQGCRAYQELVEYVRRGSATHSIISSNFNRPNHESQGSVPSIDMVHARNVVEAAKLASLKLVAEDQFSRKFLHSGKMLEISKNSTTETRLSNGNFTSSVDIYHITNFEPRPVDAIIALLAASCGHKAPNKTMTAKKANFIALTWEAIGLFMPRSTRWRPRITRRLVASLSSNCTFDCTKARQELGYVPVEPLQAALQQATSGL